MQSEQTIDAILCAQSFHQIATHECVDNILETLKESGNLFLLWNRQTFDRNTFLQELKEEVIDKYAVETNREMNFEHKHNDILQLLLQNRFNLMDDGYISFPNSLKQKWDVNMIIEALVHELVNKHYGSVDRAYSCS